MWKTQQSSPARPRAGGRRVEASSTPTIDQTAEQEKARRSDHKEQTRQHVSLSINKAEHLQTTWSYYSSDQT